MNVLFAMTREMLLELVRKKDFYVLFMLLAALMLFLSSQSFFGLEGVSRYVRDLGYSLVMIASFIVSVTFSARQLPSEIEARTIYPLLAKPVYRQQVVAGKFFGSAVISILAFTLYYSVFVVFVRAADPAIDLVLFAQGYFFGVLFFCLVPSLVVFLSCFLTVAANVTLSCLAYFFMINFSDTVRDAALSGKGLSAYAASFAYYVLPHFDFYDLRIRLAHDWDPVALWVVAAVTVYTAVYVAILLCASGEIFRRREL